MTVARLAGAAGMGGEWRKAEMAHTNSLEVMRAERRLLNKETDVAWATWRLG